MSVDEIVKAIWELGNRTWHEYPFGAYCAGCDADIIGVAGHDVHKPDCEVLALVKAVKLLAGAGECRDKAREE